MRKILVTTHYYRPHDSTTATTSRREEDAMKSWVCEFSGNLKLWLKSLLQFLEIIQTILQPLLGVGTQTTFFSLLFFLLLSINWTNHVEDFQSTIFYAYIFLIYLLFYRLFSLALTHFTPKIKRVTAGESPVVLIRNKWRFVADGRYAKQEEISKRKWNLILALSRNPSLGFPACIKIQVSMTK